MLRSGRDHEREHGQALVLFALFLVVILAFGAIAIDLGVLRNNRQILANTMDAGALAGGTQLPVTGAAAETAANALIVQTIQANYPGLPSSAYTITYKCLIGVDSSGNAYVSRDVPTVCNPGHAVGTPVVASDFTGAGPTRVSACDPSLGDMCNVVYVSGSATTPFSLGGVVGVNSGSTGLVTSASCSGPCGASPVIPVDVVLIMDRTASMNSAAIAAIQAGASTVLSVFDPAIQRIALGTIGPSQPGLVNCPSASGSTYSGQPVYGVGQSPASNINFFAPYVSPSNLGDLPKWIPAFFSGTDPGLPAVTFYEKYSAHGVVNHNSTIWKAISCLYSYTMGTDLETPVMMAQQYLNAYGRPGVKKGIILETDGSPEAGNGSSHYTCNTADNTATTAKGDPNNIEIFTIYYSDGSPNCPDTSGTWRGATPQSLLQSMASPDGPGQHHFLMATSTSDLTAAFTQAAIGLATGQSKLVELYPTPVVTGVSPNRGTHLGGTTVTISGKFFTGASSVRFGGTPAQSFTVTSDTSITAKTPVGPNGSVPDVIVTTPGGVSPIVQPADQYTYN